MLSLRNQIISNEIGFLVAHGNLNQSLGTDAQAHDSLDFRDNRAVLGFSRLEKFGNSRQTAGNIFRFREFLRDLGQDISRAHRLSGVDHQNGIGRERIDRKLFSVFFHDNPRVQSSRGPFVFLRHPASFLVDNLALDDSGDFIALFMQSDAFLDIRKTKGSFLFADDRHRIRIPLGHQFRRPNRSAVRNL